MGEVLNIQIYGRQLRTSYLRTYCNQWFSYIKCISISLTEQRIPYNFTNQKNTTFYERKPLIMSSNKTKQELHKLTIHHIFEKTWLMEQFFMLPI